MPLYCTVSEILSSVRPQKRLQSIVTSTSVCVCLSVYLSVRENISVTTCTIFNKFFVHIAYGRDLVLLWQGDEILRGMSSFGGFLPH